MNEQGELLVNQPIVHIGGGAVTKERENIMWLSNAGFNGLFKLNIDTGYIELVHKFEKIANNAIMAHSMLYIEEDEIICIPYFDKRIAVYNLKTEQEHTFDIPNLQNKKGFGAYACKADNKIWLFSVYGVDDVWYYDIDKKSVTKDVELTGILNNFINGETCSLIFQQYYNTLFLCSSEKNKIYVIDLLKKTHESFSINIDKLKISKIAYDGQYYWISQENSQTVIQWDKKSGLYTEYKAHDEKWVTGKTIMPYSEILFIDSEVILINYYAQNVMRVNKEKKIVENVFQYPKKFKIVNEISWGPVFSKGFIQNHELLLIPQRGNMILRYDFETQLVAGIELGMPQNRIPYLRDMYREKSCMDGIIRESEELYTLYGYMDLLKPHRAEKGSQKKMGSMAYEMLRGFV